jgi:hypothetical protein
VTAAAASNPTYNFIAGSSKDDARPGSQFALSRPRLQLCRRNRASKKICNRKKIAIDCRNDDGSFVLGMSTYGNIAVIYALPCRHSEAIICSWNEQEEAAAAARVMGA